MRESRPTRQGTAGPLAPSAAEAGAAGSGVADAGAAGTAVAGPRPVLARGARRLWTSLLGGGTDGNERLTALTGVVLIAALAALGITILRIRQLIWEHLFIGLMVLGPVALKLASTGYRFSRYYAGSVRYRRKGPPFLPLRVLAPIVVISTLVVFASGIVLLVEGPSSRGEWLLIHKASFILWLGATALHVLGHLPETARVLGLGERRTGWRPPRSHGGAAGRWISLTGALVGGVVLALVLVPHFGAWTAPGAFPHHSGDH
jgi:hypothetical protein